MRQSLENFSPSILLCQQAWLCRLYLESQGILGHSSPITMLTDPATFSTPCSQLMEFLREDSSSSNGTGGTLLAVVGKDRREETSCLGATSIE